MSHNPPKNSFTILSGIGILLLGFYFADAILANKDIASSSLNEDRAKQRKQARSEITASHLEAAKNIEAAKAVILNEWGTSAQSGYSQFQERVEKKYPTPVRDAALDEFE